MAFDLRVLSGSMICALACAPKASPNPRAEAFNTDVFFMLLMFSFLLIIEQDKGTRPVKVIQ
jgi:hypothetical protein